MKNMKFWRTTLVATLVLTVMLSVTGGTIAWFTDTVTSSANVIQSGTLDLDVYYSDDNGTNWAELDENAPALFNHDKWEPGFVQTKAVKLVNAGNLALKYELMFQPTADTSADQYRLEDVIDVYMSKDAAFTRESIKSAQPVATLAQLMYSEDEDGAVHGEMLPSGENGGDVVYIALKMQESAGNDYQNLSVGNGFGLKIVATQLAHERDSFGPEYDKDANAKYEEEIDPQMTVVTINSMEEFKQFDAAVDNNGKYKDVSVANNSNVYVKLNTDLDLSTYTDFTGVGNGDKNRFDGVFNGYGHTIKNWTVNTNWTYTCSFFRTTFGADVKHVTFEDFNLGAGTTKGTGYGVVIGMVGSGDSVVEDVTVKNSIIKCKGNFGAVVGGMTEGHLTIKDCVVTDVQLISAAGNCGVLLGDGYSYKDYEASGFSEANNKVNNVTWTKSDEVQETVPLYNYEK